MRYAPLCLPTAECKITTSGSASFRQPSAKCKTITCHLSCDIAAHAVCKAQRPVMILQRCACHPRSAKKIWRYAAASIACRITRRFGATSLRLPSSKCRKTRFGATWLRACRPKGQNKKIRRYMTAPSAKCKITNSGAVSLCLPSTRCKTTRFGVAYCCVAAATVREGPNITKPGSASLRLLLASAEPEKRIFARGTFTH